VTALPTNFFHQALELLNSNDSRNASRQFVRGLILFTFIKVFFWWRTFGLLYSTHEVISFDNHSSRMLFWPALLIDYNVTLFFLVLLALLVLCFCLKPTFVTNMIFFWIVASLFVMRAGDTNGSDTVLFTFAALSIPLVTVNDNESLGNSMRTVFANGSRILIQWQVILIYFVSGWDKISTPLWRSGDAFLYISKNEYLFNPVFEPLVSSLASRLVLTWVTIAFELGFPFLVKIKRTKLAVLCVGIVFHLVIWQMFSLPDFAFIMIISYLIFLDDSDLKKMRFLKQ
jgi:hypothetical protein